MKVTVVIPNFNGAKYIADCMDSLAEQLGQEVQALVVDNGSTDGSLEILKENYPYVKLIELGENTGFCHAVNVGIQASHTPYVILLNNDTKVLPGFCQTLLDVMERPENQDVFSASSRMIDMWNPELMDDAGDRYCALGWAFARGKGKKVELYDEPAEVFAACGGAAIYRCSMFDKIGYFDELHFAYLEDMDIGYRARIYGCRNLYEPSAKVLHAGSASSGSRYNAFKTRLSSANNVYLIWKNMPLLQWIFNLPLLLAGFSIKFFFFLRKGMGGMYAAGCVKGLKRCFSKEARSHKVHFRWRHLGNYLRIQVQLWANIARRFTE